MIIQHSDLADIRKKHQNQTIVLGSGVFDLIHRGHADYLQSLKRHGDIVVVLVKSDARVSKFKDPSRPIVPEQDRAYMVSAIQGVDYAFVAPHVEAPGKVDSMYESVFESLQPDVFCTGNDEWQKLSGLGTVKVVVEDRSAAGHYKSTTDLISRIAGSKNDI